MPRHRSVTIVVNPASDDHYRVMILGDGLARSVIHGGRSALKKTEIDVFVRRLREAWEVALVRHPGETDASGKETHPFADHHNLTGFAGDPAFCQAMLKIARLGYQLFEAFFQGCNPESVALLSEHLRAKEQTITIVSDDVLIPWGMLYLPEEGASQLADGHWSFDGFLGYRHRIEQTLHDMPEGWTHHLKTDGTVRVGAFWDRKLAILKGVLDPLSGSRRTSLTVHDDSEALKKAFSSSLTDQLILFLCHGYPVSADWPAHIKLSDPERILATDFEFWLAQNQLRHCPVVFAPVCFGGQLGSILHSAFGSSFLKHGGNCLVGPQIAIPQSFGSEYSQRFLDLILSGWPVGDAVYELTRQFANEYNSPYGLVMSLYRGMDTFFDHPAEPSAGELRQ